MIIQLRVWYTKLDGSIEGDMPIEKNYDIALIDVETDEEKFELVNNAVANDNDLENKANITWQFIT